MAEEPERSFGDQVWGFHVTSLKKTVTGSSGIQLLEEQKQFLSLWLNGLKKYYIGGTNWGEH